MSSGTWGLALSLANTYVYDSGYHIGNNVNNNTYNQAQAVKMPQYTGGTISGTISGYDWEGRGGGILAFHASGKLIIPGTVQMNGNNGGSGTSDCSYYTAGGGFRSGWGSNDSSNASRGEGYYAAYMQEGPETRDNGGGGGNKQCGKDFGNGAGGSNASQGGQGIANGGCRSYPGYTVGTGDCSIMFFGGGGGGACKSSSYTNAGGGSGGGIIVIYARELEITGYVQCNGGNGGSADVGGGGGAGGCILIKSETITFTNNHIQCNGGSGGTGQSNKPPTNNGGVGWIRIEACDRTGTTNQGSVSYVTGGQDWCGVYGGMI